VLLDLSFNEGQERGIEGVPSLRVNVELNWRGNLPAIYS
jgi:hypothetical protein